MTLDPGGRCCDLRSWGGGVVTLDPMEGGVMTLDPRGVGEDPCDLSQHAFELTCLLPPHQLRLNTSAAAYILLAQCMLG